MTEKCAESRRRFKILICCKKRSTAKKQRTQKDSTTKKAPAGDPAGAFF